jgi:murein DD-endopeptidase MepM/ murein hydrolase activator NlpD
VCRPVSRLCRACLRSCHRPPTTAPLSLAFPVLGPVTIGDDVSDSVVIFGLTMQPVLAAADGVVTAVQPSDPVSGDVRVMITDERGVTYRYSGLNDDTPGTDDGDAPLRLRVSTIVEVGATVRAGQIIGFIGNSDPVPTGGETFLDDGTSVWPHLRFGITGANGEALDAYGPLIDAVFRQSCTVGIGQWSIGLVERSHRHRPNHRHARRRRRRLEHPAIGCGPCSTRLIW